MTKEEIIKKAYVERDVSWMYFNHRILQEAKKEFVPLLERLSFLGIYSNNLDEFFRVRVASLNRMIDRNLTKDMEAQIKKSLKTINKLNESYSKEYTEAVDQVFRELEVHKVRLVTETNLNDEQKNFLTQFFYDKLNGSVNPIWLNEIDDLSTLEDNRIYLAIEKTEMENNDEDEKGKKKKDDKKGKKKYAVVKVLGEDSFKRRIRQHHVSGRRDPLLSAFSFPRIQGEFLPCLFLQVYQGCGNGDGQWCWLRYDGEDCLGCKQP